MCMRNCAHRDTCSINESTKDIETKLDGGTTEARRRRVRMNECAIFVVEMPSFELMFIYSSRRHKGFIDDASVTDTIGH